MTDRVRPYLFYDVAVSICSTCYRKVEGKIVFEDGSVYMLKRCPAHGSERVLMADDVDYYRRCREVFIKPPEMPLAFNTPVRWGCPYDCGLCADHQQHSVSFADRNYGPLQPRVPDLLRRQRTVAAPSTERSTTSANDRCGSATMRGSPTSCRSPAANRPSTLTSSLFSIELKAAPIRHLMVNTNGVRIATDEEFAKRLAGYMPDFEVYLQFDSFEAASLLALRGRISVTSVPAPSSGSIAWASLRLW